MSPRTVTTVLLVALISGVFSFSSLQGQEDKNALEELEEHHINIHNQIRDAVVYVQCRVPAGIPRGRESQTEFNYYGTGVIVDEEGYILSSTSVIPAGAEKIKIIFSSGHSAEAEVVGSSLRYEVILVRVDEEVPGHVNFGGSEGLALGQQVYSGGNAFGQGHTQQRVSFSTGIVSGIYHTESVYWQSQYEGLVIESNSAINPGTDGGPLLDGNGDLIGVITLTADQDRWLGVATPTHLFEEFVHREITYDSEDDFASGQSLYIGMTARNAESNGSGDDENGLIVEEVEEDSPAWIAGLQPGDRIFEANGEEIANHSDFEEVMEGKEIGDRLWLHVQRNTGAYWDRWTVLIRLGPRP